MAVFIFAIVISSVYGAYRSTFRITNNTESLAEFGNMGRISLERISGDLESLYSGDGGLLQGEKNDGKTGRSDQLTFTSTAHLVFNQKEQPASYATIRYRTELDEDSGLLRLYRIDKPFRPGEDLELDEEKGYLLCDSLAHIEYSYLEAGGNANEEWNSDEGGIQQAGGTIAGNFPAMIRVTLHFAESAETEGRTVFSTAVALPLSTRSTTP
jgi:general secretion pathway protein J